MKQMIVVTILTVAAFTAVTQAATVTTTGAGTNYKLQLKQDVWLELSYRNYNNYPWLLVDKHPGHPNKRALVQFEDLPNACPSEKVKSAKMYLYYVYWDPVPHHYVPYIPRHLQVHLVKKMWRQDQATTTRAHSGLPWSTPYLGLDGTDAEASTQCGTVTIFTNRPGGFVEFDITDAVKSWKNGVANNGLLIRATNELEEGVGTRFYSTYFKDASKHGFANVLCAHP